MKEKQNEVVPNVADLLFSTDEDHSTAQDELLDALDGKYDALREKLIIEALIKEVFSVHIISDKNMLINHRQNCQ